MPHASDLLSHLGPLLRRHSQFAGELVAPGALALGRQLLGCTVDCPLNLVMACSGVGGGDATTSSARASGGDVDNAGLLAQASAGTRAVRLGLLLLGVVFENYGEARDEVLRSCQVSRDGCADGHQQHTCRLLHTCFLQAGSPMATPECIGSNQLTTNMLPSFHPCCLPQLGSTKLEACLPRVLLLSRLCRAQPGMLAAHTQPLKDCLAQFATLPPAAAMALLRALWPLCRVRRELQDHGGSLIQLT